MKLKKFLLRYYPPGIILLYEQGGHQYQRTLDLLDLAPGTDVEALVAQIMQSEPLLTENRRHHIVKLINKLIEKQKNERKHEFSLLRVSPRILTPTTNNNNTRDGTCCDKIQRKKERKKERLETNERHDKTSHSPRASACLQPTFYSRQNSRELTRSLRFFLLLLLLSFVPPFALYLLGASCSRAASNELRV